MLSGKGDENREKTAIGLISNFARPALFLYISLPFFLRDYNGNFQKLPSYRIYGVNVVRLVHFFLLPLIFILVAASISHFLTAATNFSCCSSNKKCLLCFLFPRCSSLSIFFLDNTDIETVSAFRFRLY